MWRLDEGLPAKLAQFGKLSSVAASCKPRTRLDTLGLSTNTQR